MNFPAPDLGNEANAGGGEQHFQALELPPAPALFCQNCY